MNTIHPMPCLRISDSNSSVNPLLRTYLPRPFRPTPMVSKGRLGLHLANRQPCLRTPLITLSLCPAVCAPGSFSSAAAAVN